MSLSNCTIASLPVCTAGVDCPRFQITVRHFGDGTASDNQFTATNTAFALAQNEADPDLANNNANNNTPATAYFIARADVAVSKTDNPDPVSAGQLLTYTITASNPAATSGSRAFNVGIDDSLPAGLVYLSATAKRRRQLHDHARGRHHDRPRQRHADLRLEFHRARLAADGDRAGARHRRAGRGPGRQRRHHQHGDR